MIRLIWKNNGGRVLFLTFITLCLVMIYLNKQTNISEHFPILNNLENKEDVATYLNSYEKDELGSAILKDNVAFQEKEMRIESLQFNEEDEVDLLQAMMNTEKISNEKLEQKAIAYHQPGQYSNTVQNDISLVLSIARAYENSTMLSKNAENNVKRANKYRKRSEEGTFTYRLNEKLSINYEKIETDIRYVWTRPVNVMTSLFDKDVWFLFLVAVIGFGMFSSLKENGYMRYILTTQKGVNYFAKKYYVGYGILITGAYLLYCMMYWGKTSVYFYDGNEVLSAPIQVLEGMANSPLPITIGSYLLILAVVRYLHIMALYSLIALISMLSKNKVVSAVLSLGLVLSQLFVGSTLSDAEEFSGLFLLKSMMGGRLAGVVGKESYGNMLGFPVHALNIIVVCCLLIMGGVWYLLKYKSASIAIKE